MLVSTISDKLMIAGVSVISRTKDYPAGGTIELLHGIKVQLGYYHMEVIARDGKVVANNVQTMDDLLTAIYTEWHKYDI